MHIAGVNKSQLSRNRQHLVEQMQELDYGTIKCQLIIDGEPVETPSKRVCPRRKLTGNPRPRRKEWPNEFLLKPQVIELFDEMKDMKNCTITIVVRDGLPCEFTYE